MLAEEKTGKSSENFHKSYLFPIIGLIALLSFAGTLLLSSKSLDLQLALKIVIKQALVYFGSFYLISFILSEYVFPRFGLAKDLGLSEQFAGYSSSLIYVVAMAQSLFPGFFWFLGIVVFYTIYIIWVGAAQFLKIEENQWTKFTIFASIIIMMVPHIVRLLVELMPGMKIRL